ncbi:hypothetical protein CO112_03520 [Candidatus Dojkabacteria bacterium CG_4_9_14_3_um_filter_150_Dojkabacteria_WS6_41_13]|nr:MAG: hypothetical protein CO112_03520 [Candidatus Dojkabacteria bacterium CG_4_9_14_3_um_filter_150_Dojkabacteria_WS6_41_13]
MRYIVTTANRFTDIDGYACCIAYADLLRKEGKDAIAVLPGILNESVIPQVKAMPAMYDTTLISTSEDVFVMQDISEIKTFAGFVILDKVVEVFDHHFGYELEWRERIGERAKIEKIGACATLVVEEACNRNLLKDLDMSSQKLLYTAIFANSLNLKSSNTTPRDIHALELLAPLVDFPSNWQEIYFEAMQKNILLDPINSLKNDLKITEINGKEWAIGQLELWNGKAFFDSNEQNLTDFLANLRQEYAFVTVPSILEGKTYVLAKNETTRMVLRKLGFEDKVPLSSLRSRKEWISGINEQKD